MPNGLTPGQCRAARGLIDWTQEQLAERAGVSRSTVRDFEKGRHDLHRASAAVIRSALEAAGVVLIAPCDRLGPGVRLAGGCAVSEARELTRSGEEERR
jgi:transcriptional regulator with XRE-family HTH domain